MQYRVISRFWDAARGVYVDPGEDCPELDSKTVLRLVAAGCLEREPEKPKAKKQDRKPRKAGKAKKPPAED